MADENNTDTGAATSGAETESNTDDSTLTDTGAAEGSTDTNSDTGAVAAGEDAGTSDDGQSDSEAGSEGSQLPPDTYADFVLPEGMPIDNDALVAAAPMLKEMGATQEQAQKLVDWYAGQVQASSQAQVDTFNQLMSDWSEQSKNDSEFGGDNFDKNVKTAQSAINKYGTPELKQLLEDHGMGNHPEVVRFMVRVGSTLKEDIPGATGSGATSEQDRLSILYPNDT